LKTIVTIETEIMMPTVPLTSAAARVGIN